jgi:hypothetical protein
MGDHRNYDPVQKKDQNSLVEGRVLMILIWITVTENPNASSMLEWKKLETTKLPKEKKIEVLRDFFLGVHYNDATNFVRHRDLFKPYDINVNAQNEQDVKVFVIRNYRENGLHLGELQFWISPLSRKANSKPSWQKEGF